MASPQDSNKLISNLGVTHYDFDPDVTSAVDVAWVDMRDFESLMVSFMRTVGTSVVTLDILGNPASDGSGTDVTVKSKTFTAGQPDAVGDYVFLECTAHEVVQEAEDAGVDNVRYVTASISLATGTDEGVVTYILGDPNRAHDALSADLIA